MAMMIPPSPPEDATLGERRVYHLFEKLPALFTAWINPSLDGVTADLILYTPKNGLIVFEVKDWTLDQVVSADRNEVQLRVGWEVVKRSCPLGQTRMYLNRLKALFQRPGEKLFLLPLQCGVVFPNMRRAEFTQRLSHDVSIQELADPATTLFRDDLDALEQAHDKGGFFQQFLDVHFARPFAYEHSAGLVQIVRKKLGQSVIAVLPARDWKREEKTLVALDEAQEHLALQLPAGRRLLRGPAGSGKTLVLVRRAEELLKKGKAGTVLFLCYNHAFAGYLRRLLSEKGVPLGPEGVDVVPVFDLMARMLGGRLEEKAHSEYYETIADLVVEELEAGRALAGAWSAVLVDEAQDFSAKMVQFVKLLLPQGASLLAAMDADQHLYENSAPEAWLDVPGIKTFTLKKRYRSTRQIMAFAADWLDADDYVSDEALGVMEGEMPEVRHASDKQEAAAWAAAELNERRRSGFSQGNMAVLYAKTDGDLPQRLLRETARLGMMAVWPAEDTRAKRRYDITVDSVTISTIHSMKGMDFAHVTLVLPRTLAQGREKSLLKDISVRREAWEKRRKQPGQDDARSRLFRALVYVGMTRARQSLSVIWYEDGAKTATPEIR